VACGDPRSPTPRHGIKGGRASSFCWRSYTPQGEHRFVWCASARFVCDRRSSRASGATPRPSPAEGRREGGKNPNSRGLLTCPGPYASRRRLPAWPGLPAAYLLAKGWASRPPCSEPGRAPVGPRFGAGLLLQPSGQGPLRADMGLLDPVGRPGRTIRKSWNAHAPRRPHVVRLPERRCGEKLAGPTAFNVAENLFHRLPHRARARGRE